MCVAKPSRQAVTRWLGIVSTTADVAFLGVQALKPAVLWQADLSL